jgi:mannose-6-phosphate isomerase
VNLRPVRLEPVFDPRPWGTRTLLPLYPEKIGLRESIGEAWLTGNQCKFADGPFAGKKLGEVWPQVPAEWAGTALANEKTFPLLVKFLFTEDKPSVQVHPHDEYAARHEADKGGRGKTEMWYVVSARKGAEVLVGLKPGVTRESFRKSIEDCTAENNLARIPMQADDAVFVPAGTAHTIGGGLVLCEIQQHSDLTYRVYDYDRRDAQGSPRTLHVDKALDVIKFGKQVGGKLDPVTIERGPITETYLVSCSYFATERWDFHLPIGSATVPEHFDLLIFLEGSGRLEWGHASAGVGGESAPFSASQLWLLPAALGNYKIVPENRTALLRTYVPSSPDEIVRRLAGQGIPKKRLSRLVFS